MLKKYILYNNRSHATLDLKAFLDGHLVPYIELFIGVEEQASISSPNNSLEYWEKHFEGFKQMILDQKSSLDKKVSSN